MRWVGIVNQRDREVKYLVIMVGCSLLLRVGCELEDMFYRLANVTRDDIGNYRTG